MANTPHLPYRFRNREIGTSGGQWNLKTEDEVEIDRKAFRGSWKGSIDGGSV